MSIVSYYQWFTMDILCHWGLRVWTLNWQNHWIVSLGINCKGNFKNATEKKIQAWW